MLEKLYESLYMHPKEAHEIGTLLQWVSFVLVLFGLVSHTYVLVISLMQGLIPSGRTEIASIAQLVPSVPTWWIPESAPAFALVVLVGIAGVLISMEAKKCQRIWDAM